MTIIEALLELLSCDSVNGNSVTDAILEEDDPLAKLRKITLSHLTPGMLVLHIDRGRTFTYQCVKKKKSATIGMSPLFTTEGQHDCHRGCDAVLVRTLSDGDCELFYIELKSDSPSGFAGQFRSTRCFFRYVQTLLKEFWEIDMKISRERFIVFHTDTQNGLPSLGKQPTRFSPKGANRPEEPEKHIVRDHSTVRCTQLF